MIDHIQKLFTYDRWADGVVIASLESVANVDQQPAVVRLVCHLMAAKEIWHARIVGNPHPPTERFPTTAVADAISRLNEMNARFRALTDSQPDVNRIVQYADTMGNRYQHPLGELLIHVANHGTYHRGQLATAIKAAGGTPAVSDYIAWVRAGGPT